MAPVRNRRNPGVLVDLVRSHALVFRFQRETGPDGAVVAAREDFRYAAALFAELHGAGGSLGGKVDRNEDLVLALAARFKAEEFTVADVQWWTGWSYHKARRLLMGHLRAGIRYPGLLDRSPALSVVDRTTSDDDGERAATRRQHVFLFDPGIHREARASGTAWLEDDPAPGCSDGPCTGGAHGGTHIGTHDTADAAAPVAASEAGEQDSAGQCVPFSGTHSCDDDATADAGRLRAPGAGTHMEADLSDIRAESGSEGGAAGAVCVQACVPPCVPALHPPDPRTYPDPRRFKPTGAPLAEPCDLCGRLHSFYRERHGGPGRLCRACFARAVERERRHVPPLPAVIDPAALRRAAAEVGRCDVCDLAAAHWHGDRTRLCDACYQREVRRGLARGDAPAEA